jgi:hypothetical protein
LKIPFVEKDKFALVPLESSYEKKAEELLLKKCKFEIQELKNGFFHVDCSKEGMEGPIALELCEDEKELQNGLKKIVEDAYFFVFEKNKEEMVEFWDEDEDPENFWKTT